MEAALHFWQTRSPGQVLFYLVRAWGGDLVGDDGWGRGSGDAERVPGAGDCPTGP